jgi:hypothetical protein
MSKVHEHSAPWAWALAGHEAASLSASPVARWLRVDEGCLWVTPEQAGPETEDLWLQPGDSLELPAGSRWVLQAWPKARLSVLLAPAAASPAPARSWWQSPWVWPWVLPDARGQRLPAQA